MKLVRKTSGTSYDLILTIENEKDAETLRRLCVGIDTPLAFALTEATRDKLDHTYYVGNGR